MSKLKPRRKIDGKWYNLWETSHTKTRAKKEAARIRKAHGMSARVVPVPGSRNYHRVFVKGRKK